MKKIRILGIVLCIVCAIFVLTGCESNEENKNEKKNTSNSVTSNQSTENNKSNDNTTGNQTAPSSVQTKKEYTEQELCQMSLDHYEKKNNYRPGHAAAQKNDDGTVTIQLYDSFSDHNSTSDWYTINPKTGKGKNLMEEDIDISPFAK